MRIETDVAVIGSGAAGATLAKELAEAGRDVVLVEKGSSASWPLGSLLSLVTLYEHTAWPPFFPRTMEGAFVLRGICTGGCTTIFGGNASMPPAWLASEYGIELGAETKEAIREIGIGVPPDEYLDAWSTAARFRQAAGEAGLAAVPQMKFIYPGKCPPSCDYCAFGCARNARWSARTFLRRAAKQGARIMDRTEALEIIVEGARAAGVRVRRPEGPAEIHAEKVICSAGGLGTPVILMRSGIREAGSGLSVDPSGGVCGMTAESWGPGGTFAVSYEDVIDSEGFMISNAGGGITAMIRLALYPVSGMLHPGSFRRAFAVFVKISDSSNGTVHPDGTISKPFTKQDAWKMNRGIELSKKILEKAGCDPGSIFSTPLDRTVASHHCGTAAIDRVVDRNLETRIRGLYVCDTGVLPRSPGRPPTLTAVALAKWLAKRI